MEKNDWNGAKLNIFLNGDYLTRIGDASNYGLKELAQSQIKDAKYYLGGSNYESIGSTDDIYNWERGTEVFSYENYCLFNSYWDNPKCTSNYCENNPTDLICNVTTRSTFWVGKVALIYPSDDFMIYSKEVENECYSDPERCYYREPSDPTSSGVYNYPETGWLYNSNNLEGQNTIDTIWSLSPHYRWSSGISIISSDGRFSAGTSNASFPCAVRPVVYLKPSINIISGEGTEQNPYIFG